MSDVPENAALHAQLTHEIAELRRAAEELRTSNRELEQRVREQAAELVAANRELQDLSYSVSHDLRSPLRAIEGFSQLLLEDHGEALPEGGRDLLQRVRKASGRMSELIAGMLHLSRITRAQMRRRRVDLSEMARGILGELCLAEPEREVTCAVEEGLVASADEELLQVALQHLLGNALKFTRKTEGARVEVGASPQPDGRAAYLVRDNGVGFDMKYAGKLFGAFQRLHRGDEFEGIGVGLAAARRVINRHAGEIWADAAEGRGATFYFTLWARNGR